MSEKIPKITEAAIEKHNGSPEQPLLSKEIFNLVGVAHRLSPEEMRNKLTNIADRVAELERKSRTDELTGLLNARGFYEEAQRLESIFTRERQDKKIAIPTALLTIDLDGFKEVNDSCGHSCGNRCLQLIAEHVQDALRDSDIFGRIGGDEFSIFLTTEEDEKGALKVAGKVRSAIEGVVTETMHREFPKYKGALSASIGVVAIDGSGAVEGEEGVSMEKVMKYADYAAYVVKAAGKRGELTLKGAREVDTDGQYQEDFLAGETLPR